MKDRTPIQIVKQLGDDGACFHEERMGILEQLEVLSPTDCRERAFPFQGLNPSPKMIRARIRDAKTGLDGWWR